jgi:centrin-3
MQPSSPLESITSAKVQKFIRESSPFHHPNNPARNTSPSPSPNLNSSVFEKMDMKGYSSFGLSTKELFYYRAVFDLFASGGNGTLSPAELRHLFAYLGINMNRSEIFKVLCEYDTEENGYLDFNDFLRVVNDRISLYDMDNIRAKREIFKGISSKDTITAESLERAFAKNGIAVSQEESTGIYNFLIRRIEERDEMKGHKEEINFNDFNNLLISLHQELGLALKQEKKL